MFQLPFPLGLDHSLWETMQKFLRWFYIIFYILYIYNIFFMRTYMYALHENMTSFTFHKIFVIKCCFYSIYFCSLNLCILYDKRYIVIINITRKYDIFSQKFFKLFKIWWSICMTKSKNCCRQCLIRKIAWNEITKETFYDDGTLRMLLMFKVATKVQWCESILSFGPSQDLYTLSRRGHIK